MTDEAIILAGGLGTRLQSIVSDVPKPMAPIHGRPFLEVLLTFLAQQNFKHVILALGYKSDIIIDHFGDHFCGIKISYVIEKEKLGTGGAIRLAMEKAKRPFFFVLNGDSFIHFNRNDIVAHLQNYKSPIIIGYKVPDTFRYGRIEYNDTHILQYCEKGISGEGVISSGVYVLPKDILGIFELNSPFSVEEDVFMKITPNNNFDLLLCDGPFIDIGIPEDYYRAQILLEKLCGE